MLQAQVQFVDGGSGGMEQLSVAVQLPGGEVLRLGAGGGRGGGGGGTGGGSATKTIDVEWRSVDDK